jgi:SAM-dependent methyltransferase
VSRLYTGLAPWFPLLSPPAEYAAEIGDVHEALRDALGRLPKTLLELGAGAGHLASHLDRSIALTLTDLAPEMLAESRKLNPSATHVAGDMRSLRLDRRFEAVLIHDAITYMTTREDLIAALTTARVHLEPGGVCLVMPDDVAETFEPETETGGSDAEDGRGLRYLEWVHPVKPGETAVDVDYVVVIKHPDGRAEVVHDRHRCGLFSREAWREAFREAGFEDVTSRPDAWRQDTFLAR